jgi:GNAT superfamily N-acetyltransferase
VVIGGWFHGALLGLGLAERIDHPGGRRTGSVTLVYVEPGAREVGVGESILERIVDWCATKGCTGIDVMALPGDQATKSLLERSGFIARKIVMHRAIIPGD